MRIRNIVLAGITLTATALLLQGTARAQDEFVAPDKGTIEVGLSGHLDLDVEGEETASIQVSFLPYLNPNIQVGGTLSYYDFGSENATVLEARGNYNFTSPGSVSKTIPYAGLAFGWADTSVGDSQTAWGGQVGVKHFLNNNVSVFAEVQYRDFEGDFNSTVLYVGLNTYLRK